GPRQGTALHACTDLTTTRATVHSSSLRHGDGRRFHPTDDGFAGDPASRRRRRRRRDHPSVQRCRRPRCGDGEDDGGEWSPTPRLARGHRF
ncbi:Bowman-Birk type trypsin inhibitor, partial [Zea mays]